MVDRNQSKYYLVAADVLPEVFIKVVEAKTLLETGEAATVAEATGRVGISRSAFYKYRSAVSAFHDMKSGRIVTFHMLLRDQMGVLSAVLAIFADSGANILTINQSIPVNGTAVVTISAVTEEMEVETEELLSRVKATKGVLQLEVLAG